MTVDPNVALAVRRDLHAMAERHDDLLAALAHIAAAPKSAEAIERAFRAGLEFPGLPSIGELASRAGEARDDLLLAATDTDAERERVSALIAAVRQGVTFRALRHVFKESFRSKTLDEADRTREVTRTLLDQPVWPGSATTLRELYVPPACALEFVERTADSDDADSEATSAEVTSSSHQDPIEAFATARRIVGAQGLIVLGGPSGVGKSTVLSAIAESLANDLDVLPLVVGRGMQLPLALAFAGLHRVEGFEPELLPPVVWLHDGPDLEPLPVRDLYVRTSTQQEELSRWGPASALIRLDPFDAGRVRYWAHLWNLRASHPVAVESLLPHVTPTSGTARTLAWVAVPFTLLLVARLAEEGRIFRVTADPSDLPHLFREMVTWACEQVSYGGELSVVRLRDELRAAATQLITAPTRPFGEAALTDEGVIIQWQRPDEEPLPFPLRRTEGGGVRFFSDAFVDYLFCEHVAFECSRLCTSASDVGGARRAAGYAADLARRWVWLFGRLALNESLESLLRLMIPSWQRFVRGQGGTPRPFAAAWRTLTHSVYGHLASESSWRTVVDVAQESDHKPSTLRARSLFALLRLGGLVDATRRDPFAPEDFAPGTIGDVLRLLRARHEALPPLSFAGAITLHRANLPQADLVGADLSGIDLSGANLIRADLRGADLRRTKLDRADLRSARLDGALVDEASMTDAVLTDTSRRGVRFSAGQRAAAAWTHDEARARGLRADPGPLLLF